MQIYWEYMNPKKRMWWKIFSSRASLSVYLHWILIRVIVVVHWTTARTYLPPEHPQTPSPFPFQPPEPHSLNITPLPPNPLIPLLSVLPPTRIFSPQKLNWALPTTSQVLVFSLHYLTTQTPAILLYIFRYPLFILYYIFHYSSHISHIHIYIYTYMKLLFYSLRQADASGLHLNPHRELALRQFIVLPDFNFPSPLNSLE